MLCLFYVLVSCSTLPDDFQQVEEGEQELSDMAGGSDSLVAPVFQSYSLSSSQDLTLRWTVSNVASDDIDGFKIYIKGPDDILFEEDPYLEVGNVDSVTITDPLEKGFGEYQFSIQLVTKSLDVSPLSSIQSVLYFGYKDVNISKSVFLEHTLDSPNAVAVDDDGNIYVTDTNHHRILKLDSLITDKYHLSDINKAIADMRRGQVVGKCAITFN